jgi:KDO2-lipid IV(A) lauroyltransferase
VPSKRPPDEGRLIQLVYYAYVAFSLVARWLPERVAYGLAHTVGTMQARRTRGKNTQVERNLARITGLQVGSEELHEVVAEAFRSYSRYWLETFRAVREKAPFFLERVQPKDPHHIGDEIAKGRGAVVLIGHLGNWDAAGAWAGAVGWQVVTVAETLKPRRMFDFFVAHREALGLVIYPAEKGVTSKLIEAVQNNSVVPVLGDRDLKGDGVEVEFFGEPATFPRGAAAVAVRTGSPLIFTGIRGRRLDDGRWGWAIEMNPPIEPPPADDPDAVDKLTTIAVGQLEDYIRKYPTEWHVFQPFWTADRAERARR